MFSIEKSNKQVIDVTKFIANLTVNNLPFRLKSDWLRLPNTKIREKDEEFPFYSGHCSCQTNKNPRRSFYCLLILFGWLDSMVITFVLWVWFALVREERTHFRLQYFPWLSLLLENIDVYCRWLLSLLNLTVDLNNICR